MAITFSKDNDENWETLNEFLHGLLGYGAQGWHSLSIDTLRLALDQIQRFQQLHVGNLLATRWQWKLEGLLRNLKGLQKNYVASPGPMSPTRHVFQVEIGLSEPLSPERPSSFEAPIVDLVKPEIRPSISSVEVLAKVPIEVQAEVPMEVLAKSLPRYQRF